MIAQVAASLAGHTMPEGPLFSPAPLDSSQLGILREARERGLGEEDGGPVAKERGLGPEAGTGQVGGSPAGNTITCNLTGTAQAGVLAWDQWWMFSLLADQPVNPTYAIGNVDVITEDGLWTPALVSLFFGLEPMFLVNANITAASANAVISGMSLRIRRSDPFGTTAGNLSPQAAYQNAADFRGDRGQFPIAEAIDSWTWVRMVSPIQAAPAKATVVFFFGPRPDRRGVVPRVSPQIVRSVNR